MKKVLWSIAFGASVLLALGASILTGLCLWGDIFSTTSPTSSKLFCYFG